MRIVRRATIEDIPSFFQVCTAVQDNAASLDELAVCAVTLDSVTDLLSRNERFIRQRAAAWVVEEHSQVLGFVIARVAQADVLALLVLPQAMGQGLGSKLLAEAERWLCSQGVCRAWLSTHRGSQAVSFYDRLRIPRIVNTDSTPS